MQQSSPARLEMGTLQFMVPLLTPKLQGHTRRASMVCKRVSKALRQHIEPHCITTGQRLQYTYNMKMLLISVPYIYAKTLFLSESRNRNVEVEESITETCLTLLTGTHCIFDQNQRSSEFTHDCCGRTQRCHSCKITD